MSTYGVYGDQDRAPEVRIGFLGFLKILEWDVYGNHNLVLVDVRTRYQ